MELKHINGFSVTGIKVRTTNAAEMDTSTAKIAGLWQHFYQDVMPQLPPGSKIYGVYCHYQSDYRGEYDIFAAADTLSADLLEESESTNIQSGQYLVFSKTGEMPQAVISLWGEVWEYFNQPDCPHHRAYTSDFEFYKSANEVEIAIAVK
ncbi:effector binding domain-containing protein [Neptunicella marina]|uniref:Effector binding domain-containing protein n=1 Tax=Neptunicella marina TaxID=2125989 RepID=A0A8J6IX17_9ALTE|nr:effector binding domain-containing protein [Neptunicella marina]